jgi:hypothetical protein
MAASRLSEPRTRWIEPLLATALLGAVVVFFARPAYGRLFGVFPDLDDEGYVMQTVRSFLSGAPLYDQVFSQYGPAFYVWSWIVHRLLAVPLSHDGVRFITLACWFAAALLAGVTTYRATRSPFAAALASALILPHLAPLVSEPGHPEAPLICAVLVTAAVLADSTRGLSRRQLLGCGALVAFASLAKLNVGAYLGLGLLLALAAGSPLPVALRVIAVAAVGVVPFLILRLHVAGFGWTYPLVVGVGIVTTGAVAMRLRGLPWVASRLLLQVAVAGVATGFALLLPALLRGTTVPALFDAVVVQPLRLGAIFFVPADVPRAATTAAIGSLVACAIVLTLPRRADAVVRWVIAPLKIATPFVLLVGTSFTSMIGFLTPFLWVAAVGLDPAAPDHPRRVRVTLAALAALQTLQAYPVAGTQLALSTTLTVIVAVIAFADGLDVLRAIRRPPPRLLLHGIAVGLVLYSARPAFALRLWTSQYRHGYEFRLPGTERMRVSREQAARFHWVTATATASCRGLVTVPGMYSLNAWTGIPPPTHANVTVWFRMLPAHDQQRIWSTLDTGPDSCVVVRTSIALLWSGMVPLDALEVGTHLRGRSVLATDGDFQILVKNAPPAGHLTELLAGRQAFSPLRTAAPVAALFLNPPGDSTVRLWFRATTTGGLLGCHVEKGFQPVTTRLVYVGNSGALLAGNGLRSPARVNDGAWHHVAVIRDRGVERLFVDGAAVAEAPSTPAMKDLGECQVGTGYGGGRPDTPNDWMPLTGDIDAVGVTPYAWSAADVAADFTRTRPRH